MKNNKKGFTLAELLVVVGIIAVLIAIAIPVFTSQLEKSREAVDAANIRSAYAEVMTEAITGTPEPKKVDLKQQTTGWTEGTTFEWPDNLYDADEDAIAGGVATLTYDEDAGGEGIPGVTVEYSAS